MKPGEVITMATGQLMNIGDIVTFGRDPMRWVVVLAKPGYYELKPILDKRQ